MQAKPPAPVTPPSSNSSYPKSQDVNDDTLSVVSTPSSAHAGSSVSTPSASVSTSASVYLLENSPFLMRGDQV